MLTPRSFLQIIPSSDGGGQVNNYSGRFGLAAMTGSFSTPVASGVAGLVDGDMNGPASSNPRAAAPDGPYAVPYNLQVGNVRYAPMAEAPGTKITKLSASRRYPTSAVVKATTWLAQASISTTVTQSNTNGVSSRENTVRPARDSVLSQANDCARLLPLRQHTQSLCKST